MLVSIDGKLVRLLHLSHALAKPVALEVSIAGKLVSPEQPIHAPWLPSPNLVTLDVLIAGKLVRLLQSVQAPANDVAELKSSKGNEVRLLQLRHAPDPLVGDPKIVPLDVSITGKLVRLEQLYQALWKLVPLDVSSNGKLVRLVQPRQVSEKYIPLEVSIAGKLVRLLQSRQVVLKFVPLDVSINGKLVRLEQLYQACWKLVPPVASTVASNASRLLHP